MSDIKQFEPLWGLWRTEGAPIGEGSFGVVYKAVREEFGKKYYAAIKHISIPSSQSQLNDVISEGVANNDKALKEYFDSIVQDLVTEIALMSKVKGHTNIVSYEDHLIIPKPTGIGYDIIIRMELLTGLNGVLRQRKMTNKDVIKLGIDICSALEICAEKGVLHRDIKPSNIFVNDLGDYKLGDFGVARELERTTGMSRKGTYVYMAPEVYKGEPTNLSADTFSLGMVLYRLLNGNRAPFLPADSQSIKSGDNEAALLRRMSGEALPAPAYADKRLADVILKAVEFKKEKRYKSPTEFKKALLSLADGSVVERVIPVVSTPTNNSANQYGYAAGQVNAAPGYTAYNGNGAAASYSAPSVNAVPNAGYAAAGAYPMQVQPQQQSGLGSINSNAAKVFVAVLVMAVIALIAICAWQCGKSADGCTSAKPPKGDGTVIVAGGNGGTDIATTSTTTTTAPSVEDNGEPDVHGSLSVGQVFEFGSYEQDGITQNGAEPIEWKVLDVESDRALVISSKGLFQKRFHDSIDFVTWEDCDLRRYLNSGFISEAFTQSERKRIIEVEITTSANPVSGVEGCGKTKDKVFLLSIAEVSTYFSSDLSRIAKPTKNAIAQGCSVRDDGGKCVWWLRSPGGNKGRNTAEIDYEGKLIPRGTYVNSTNPCVRPCFYISL